MFRHLMRSLLAGALVVSAAACSDNSATTTSTAAPPSVAAPTTPRVTTGTPDDCPSAMPGDILSAADAVVRFSPEMVCPGYVTIKPGTPVGFVNRSDKAETVKIAAKADGSPLWSATLEPGERTEAPTDKLGVTYYQISAIPSFVGTIEVKN